MRWRAVRSLLGASIVLAGCRAAVCSLAQTSRDWDRCAGKDSVALDHRIDACTIVIQSVGEAPKNRALAFIGP